MHDGSGFFSETWVSPDRNPKRYGQSIVADTYTTEKNSVKIELGEMAREVCRRIKLKTLLFAGMDLTGVVNGAGRYRLVVRGGKVPMGFININPLLWE